MAKLILLNGPMGCGKSEVVKYLSKRFPLVERRCKDKLFKLTMEFFCVNPQRFWETYNKRELKEAPLEDYKLEVTEYNKLAKMLGKPNLVRYDLPKYVNISVREAMIYVSEILCKPAFGTDYFGIARTKEITESEIAIDDSCGFAEELTPAIEKLGQENILLVRIHGRGSFEGDSRSYIADGVITNTVDVNNTGLEIEFKRSVLIAVGEFLNGKS